MKSSQGNLNLQEGTDRVNACLAIVPDHLIDLTLLLCVIQVLPVWLSGN